jgi:hypothetical protein
MVYPGRWFLCLMTNLELTNYIRDECRNDGGWLADRDRKRVRRTRVGVVDLILFVLGQRHVRRTACC